MSGKRMLVWLAFGIFLCVVVIAGFLIPARRTGAGSQLLHPQPFSPVRTAPHS